MTAERTIYNAVARSHPKLSRGLVWCCTCGAQRQVDPANCLERGWPKCCGFTMTIDAPHERAALSTQDTEVRNV